MHWAMRDVPDGWFHHAEVLLPLVEMVKPFRMLEVGSYKGQSAVALARVLGQWGGTLTCLDVWNQTPSGPADVYPEFLANVVASGVTNITPIRAESVAAAQGVWDTFDAVYIDADHTEASVTADLAAWWPHLAVDGLLAGDDYNQPEYPGVKQAWDVFGRAVQPVIGPPDGQRGLVWLIKGVGRPALWSGTAEEPVPNRVHTTCAVCGRVVWADHVSAGVCVLCR